MNTSLRSVIVTASLGILALPVAAAQRAYVASTGNDTNVGTGCTLAAPCRSFAAAHTAVDSGGEIVALDAAGYGAVTIVKSVTITANPGFFAGIAASTGDAVKIDSEGVRVILRGININGIGATYGVRVVNAAHLSIENCVLSNFGSDLAAAVYVGNETEVRLVDSVLRDNFVDVYLSKGASASIARSSFSRSENGNIHVHSNDASTTRAVVSDSDFSFSNIAVYAESTSTGAALAWVTRSTVTRTDFGLAAVNSGGGSSVLHVSASSVVGNTRGWYQSGVGSVVESAGNNSFRGNTSNTGVLTSVGLQ